MPERSTGDPSTAEPLQPSLAAADFDVFLSYSHADARFAEALYRGLSRYRAPRGIAAPRRRLRVFRDVHDIMGTVLTRALQTHLEHSARLIVICSPAARASRHVNAEVTHFARAHGAAAIIPVLLGDEPPEASASTPDAAYPHSLIEAKAGDPLAVDYRKFGTRRLRVDRGALRPAWFQLLANIFSVSQRELERRERARSRTLVLSAGAVTLVVFAVAGTSLWWLDRQQLARQEASRALALAQNDPVAASVLARQAAATAWPRFLEPLLTAARISPDRTVQRALLRTADTPPLIGSIGLHEPLRLTDARLTWLTEQAAVREKEAAVRRAANAAERPEDAGPVRLEPVVVTGRSVGSHGWIAVGRNHVLVSIDQPMNQTRGDTLWNIVTRTARALEWDSRRSRFATFSRDGRLVAVTFDEGSVIVLDVESGATVQEWRDHSGPVLHAEFDPGGLLLATAGADGTAIVRRLGTTDSATVLRSDSGAVMHVAFDVDGQLLATGGEDGAIRIWTIGGDLRHLVQAHEGPVAAVRSSGAGFRDFISIGFDGAAKLWELKRDRARLVASLANVSDASLGPDGWGAITASYEHGVEFWERCIDDSDDESEYERRDTIPLGQEEPWQRSRLSPSGAAIVQYGLTPALWTLGLGYDGGCEYPRPLVARRLQRDVRDVVFSADGRHFATVHDDSVRVWSVEHPLLQGQVEVHDRELTLSVSPDGRRVATSRPNGTVLVSKPGLPDQTLQLEHERAIVWTEFAGTNRHLLTITSHDSIRIWQAETGKLVSAWKSQRFPLEQPSFSPDGKWLLRTDSARTRLCRVDGRGACRALENMDDPPELVQFSGDGRRLVSVNRLGGFVHDARTGRNLAVFSAEQTLARLNRDGTLALLLSRDSISIWELTQAGLTPRLQKVNELSRAGALMLAQTWRMPGGMAPAVFSADGRSIALVTHSGVEIWNRPQARGDSAASFQLQATLAGRADAIVFDATGNHLAGIDSLGTVRIWQLSTGQRLDLAHERPGAVALFSPDGSMVLTTSVYGKTTLWEVANGERLLDLPGFAGAIAWREPFKVRVLGFNSDGSRVVLTSGERVLIFSLSFRELHQKFAN